MTYMNSFGELFPGANRIRIIGQPYQYICHPKFVLKGSESFQPKIKCIGFNLYTVTNAASQCPECINNNKPSPRWIISALSRRDNQFHLYDIGYSIFEGIKALVTCNEWGDPQNYDLIIQYDWDGKFMAAIPLPKTPLTKSESLIKNLLDLEELRKITNPPDDSYIEKVKNNHYEVINESQ